MTQKSRSKFSKSSSSKVLTVAALSRGIFLLAIGFGGFGLFQMHIVTRNTLVDSMGLSKDDFTFDERTRRGRTNQQLESEQRESLQGISAEADIGDYKNVVPVHRRGYDPWSEAWVLAMQEADEMLLASPQERDATTNHSHYSWKAECLVPNTRGTEELVRRLVSENQLGDNRRPNNNKNFEHPLVPLPILNVGMPKLGSTSLYHYFKCKGLNATHWNMGTREFEGLCMRDAVGVGLPPLATCANGTDAIMQMDVALPLGTEFDGGRLVTRSYALRDDCFFPQLSLLEDFSAEAPDATLVLTFRPMHDWTRSVLNWYSILERLQKCHLPNLPRGVPDLSGENEGNTNHSEALEATMTRFFCSHVVHVRNFVKDHPTHNLIELDLYDPRTPQLLDQLFPSKASPSAAFSNDGVAAEIATLSSESCWAQHKGGFNKDKNRTKGTLSPEELKEKLKTQKRRKQAKARRERREREVELEGFAEDAMLGSNA
jgi:hypothetical protein